MGGAELVGSATWSVCHVLRCACGRLPSFIIIIKCNLAGGWVGELTVPLTVPVGDVSVSPSSSGGKGLVMSR